MEKEELKSYQKKYVRIVLSSGRVYTGKILDLDKWAVIFSDHKGFPVRVSIKDISAVEDLDKIVKKNLEIKEVKNDM